MTETHRETPAQRGARLAQVGLPARRAAVELLIAVLDKHQSLDDALSRSIASGPMSSLPQRDRALTRSIVATSLRRRGELDAILSRVLERGLPPSSGALYAILLSAAAQLIFLRTPPHAAIDLAVRQVKADPRAKRFDKLANAVLRRVAEQGEALVQDMDAARLNTPDWLWQRWSEHYGEDKARDIAKMHMVEPPLDLTPKGDPAKMAETLSGIVLPTGSVRLLAKGRIDALPGFEEGAWWVQDTAASLPASLLGDIKGKRVADLCAAPGGKTAQLVLAGAAVTAVDHSEARLKTLAGNLARLKLEAELVGADATSWHPGSQFDAVLLDAPCSSTGTVRRHPDIPYLKTPDEIARLAELQARLLDNAVALLSPGGTLVYCTCSLEPEEGEHQVAALLERHPALSLHPIEPDDALAPDWIDTFGCLRTLPCHLRLESPEISGMDGFFAVRFRHAGYRPQFLA